MLHLSATGSSWASEIGFASLQLSWAYHALTKKGQQCSNGADCCSLHCRCLSTPPHHNVLSSTYRQRTFVFVRFVALLNFKGIVFCSQRSHLRLVILSFFIYTGALLLCAPMSCVLLGAQLIPLFVEVSDWCLVVL